MPVPPIKGGAGAFCDIVSVVLMGLERYNLIIFMKLGRG